MDLFLRFTLMIPREPMDEVEGLPLEIKTYSKENLHDLTTDWFKVNSLTLSSVSFQMAVTRAFGSGDISLVTTDYFSPIVEKLLRLSSQRGKGEALLELFNF